MKMRSKSKFEVGASSEVLPKSDNNVPSQPKSANPDTAISMVACTQDGATTNLATVLFQKEDSSSAPKKTKLTREEESSLKHCEQVIERGLATFVEVGAALFQIQSQRLYRQKHDSFEAYLADRWNFKRAHAYRLISAYRVLETIRDEDGKDLAESHVRQLVRLPEDQRAEALRRAKELAGEETRTAKHIQQAVNAMLGKNPKPSSKSSDEQGDNNDGGVAAEKPTPTPAPTGGAAAPRETGSTVLPPNTELVNELLALVRGTRDLLTIKKDVKAAIQQLFRMEQALIKSATTTSYASIEIVGDDALEASNRVVGTLTQPRQLQAA